MRLKPEQKKSLELEVVPHEARLEVMRLIRAACATDDDEPGLSLVRLNEFVNIANQVMGKPIYVLEGADWDYELAEYAWHHGQRELIMRVPSTVELVEILADYLQEGMMEISTVNGILRQYGSGFKFETVESNRHDSPTVQVKVAPVESIEEADLDADHPNIRKLVARMDHLLGEKDYPGVLHTSASIFETMAKDVVQNPAVENQTLASFFDAYRKKSLLPPSILDYVLNVYKTRNVSPLAGHGSLNASAITPEEAVTLCELTKSFVRIERTLAEQAIDIHNQKTMPTKAKAAKQEAKGTGSKKHKKGP